VTNGATGSVVENLGGAVTVTVDGTARPVLAGTPATVAPSAARVCRATVDYVRGSAKYQALARTARASLDRQVDALCAGVQAVTTRLKPAQKAAAIALYKQGVTTLARAGWLTPAQADVLRAAADALI
jgi:hypothetical protein